MLSRFQQAAQATGLETRAAALDMTPYEVVIVASLIEREVKFDDEYPRVAQVVYNRLEQGETIGIDASILYGLGRTSGGLTRSELDKDTPYNIRINRGLPPTPIASPGEATLNGALNPSGGDELFYVLATKEGRSVFTRQPARPQPCGGQGQGGGHLHEGCRPGVPDRPLAVAGCCTGRRTRRSASTGPTTRSRSSVRGLPAFLAGLGRSGPDCR